MLLRVLVISFPCVCCGLEFMRGGFSEGLPYRRRFVYESRCSWRRPTSDRCLVDGGVTGDVSKQMQSQHGVYEKRFMELVVSERVSYSSKQSNDFSMILCCLPALTYRRHSMPHPFVHWNLTDCCAPVSNPKTGRQSLLCRRSPLLIPKSCYLPLLDDEFPAPASPL